MKPLPVTAARADGDHALDDVEALAQRILVRVEQGADAVLLVLLEHPPVDAGRADRGLAETISATMPTPPSTITGTISRQDRPAKKMHVQAGGQDQHARAEVGLLGHQQERHQQQISAATAQSGRCAAGPRALEPPRQHQRRGDLEQLAGLDHGRRR
jgi:hypothetical protein